MIRNATAVVIALLIMTACQKNADHSRVVTADIDNFWTAYDQIRSEEDSAKQLQILQQEFIDKASIGQQKLFEVRNYTPEEYVENIRKYPKFYASLRKNLEQKESIVVEIEQGLERFDEVYPKGRAAKIYMGIGNFRTNGTTVDSLVLFGSEMAFCDVDVNTSEFPASLQYFKNYIQENPIENVTFLSVHEFVHTQQTEAIGANLLSIVLREGSAEFIAELATGKSSTTPAIAYGKEHSADVFEQFKKEMFNRGTSYWVWSSRENKFGIRDLGYYVGFELSRHYYDRAEDKNGAIAALIELDYSDIEAVRQFVNEIDYFEESIPELEKAFLAEQPFVEEVEREGDRFTVRFSEPMDIQYRGFDYGPLGEEHVLSISEFEGFNQEATTVSFRAKITEGKKQQLVLTSNFRDQNGLELQPYLVEIGE